MAFTEPQRRALLLIVVALGAWVGLRLWWNDSIVSDPQPVRPSRDMELADRIDPNTASEATLAALPGLGLKRAGAIVAFRRQHALGATTAPAFSRLEDLLKVEGMGYATMMHLAPYLMFPPATTRPVAGPDGP
ncbi:MAG: helix-hairpin-helix domain-containing protein [Phycisphaerae bacterium]|nr:helix-hairpin-helix domain-containing protein [Phycisphaerae bacterium]MDW8260993.1 helix-hairpin-helix domain-containing protein [Phycisphaerales bacterium]